MIHEHNPAIQEMINITKNNPCVSTVDKYNNPNVEKEGRSSKQPRDAFRRPVDYELLDERNEDSRQSKRLV